MAARKGKKTTGADRRPSPPPRPRGAGTRRAVRVTPAKTPALVTDNRVRLNRFLAAAGVCSRRHADELITSGRVTVNGERADELGLRVDPATDVVRFDGRKVAAERPVYVLFNKPKGVVCTNAQHEVRKRVIDFLDDVRGRIYTVGRLDADSEGLLVLTNDGDLAQRLAHPSFGVPKTYAVLVRGRPEVEELEKARGGVWLAEGRTGGARIRIERRSRDRTYLKVTLREGRNREIRRVFARLGYPVLSLKRVRIGRLNLHGLKTGSHRFLRPAEVTDLLEAAKEGS